MKKALTLAPQTAQPSFEGEAEQLIAQAINKNVPVESLERLLAMRRELKAEQAKEKFDHAMATFQSECPTITKTKEVRTNTGALAYRYAPIESIVAQVKEALHKNGFSYSTNMVLLPDGVLVSVKVTHEAGHSETTEMQVPLGTKTNIMSSSQVVAAAQTFAKRYAFCNAFGILTGDDDTDAASTPTTQTAQDEPKQAKIASYLATPKQCSFIEKLLQEKGYSMSSLYAKYDITAITELTAEQASLVIGNLMKLSAKTPQAVTPDEADQIDLDEVDSGIRKVIQQ